MSVVATLACALTFPTATWQGEHFPVGNDSFYHARRILDAVRDLSAFYQFDPRIHAPEGSLLVWPWGYDYLMACIVRLGLAAGLATSPIDILIWIPVAAVSITIALILSVARQIGLGTGMSTLTALCMALAPTTQVLHGVEQIDHHYAELLFVLGALAGGLAWLRNPDQPRRAALLGFVLGIAPAMHNGLFVLQLPLLATLIASWLQRRRMPAQSSVAFAATLLASTLAVLIPSLAFRLGLFEFYTLSWFHLYAAGCTAAVVLVLGRFQARPSTVVGLSIGVALVLVPILGEVALAQSFIAGTPAHLQIIGEMQSPLRIAQLASAAMISHFYSYLVWAAPLTGLLCVVQCWRERTSARLLFWITCVVGLLLLSMQQRLHYFGDFALYLPWLAMLQESTDRQPHIGKKVLLLTTLGLLLVYFPSLRYQMVAPAPRANDMAFENVRPIFDPLRQACAANPGIVLADADSGHYIRYYTECSVIADNFLLTGQQMQKADEAERLLSLPAVELAQAAPYVRYVLVRPLRMGAGPNGKLRYTFGITNPLLANDLLLGSSRTVPPQFALLGEVRFPQLGNAPYAALYEIRR
ncbi:MAG TPA: hypothetical protein VH814_24540 [Steroidobacteraceae bacterium]